MMQTFERLESRVRSYSRSLPTVFTRAVGHEMWDESGRRYLDFFAGAGALNYGHNHPAMKRALQEHLEADGIAHSLDMATSAKAAFLEAFHEIVLAPRGLDHCVQFTGPTGTNAVEAALKLARKVTGREKVLSFTNGFHGMTLGSLSVTGNGFKRAGAGLRLDGVTRMPYAGYHGEDVDTLAMLDRLLEDAGSGVDAPAAAILETVQCEGGVNVASSQWLRGLSEILKRHGVLLIVDDIQVGCGRTGPFFSFEEAALEPDLICLSKSISGFGLPMALVLIRPELDVWAPGEHDGTFRGNNHAFVTARVALEHWTDDSLERQTGEKATQVASRLEAIAGGCAARMSLRGRGLVQGLAFEHAALATATERECFARGLVIETAGPQSEVLKLLPSLTIDPEALDEGLDIIEDALGAVLASEELAGAAAADDPGSFPSRAAS